MSKENDEVLVSRIRQQLDTEADGLDELTLARLKAARKQALEQRRRSVFHWIPLTALAGGATALLAVALWTWQPLERDMVPLDWDLLASGDELELIEEWEFYDWLEANQFKG